MARRVPTEPEIRETAIRLGLADADGNYRRVDRPKIAQAIMLADQEQQASASAVTDRAVFVKEVAALDRELQAAGVAQETTSRVVAAMSAALWRSVREGTAQ